LKTKTPKERLEALESVMTALAHPARRQILLTIHFRGGTMTAGEIAGRFAHTWATTTGHIRVLENAQLLNQQRIGRVRHYSINEERLAVIEEWLGWFKKKADDGLSDLDSHPSAAILQFEEAQKKMGKGSK
jgi:DNA-binding transcriptional ArsR family regulator